MGSIAQRSFRAVHGCFRKRLKANNSVFLRTGLDAFRNARHVSAPGRLCTHSNRRRARNRAREHAAAKLVRPLPALPRIAGEGINRDSERLACLALRALRLCGSLSSRLSPVPSPVYGGRLGRGQAGVRRSSSAVARHQSIAAQVDVAANASLALPCPPRIARGRESEQAFLQRAQTRGGFF